MAGFLVVAQSQEAKFIERWPNMTSAWAGWKRFDIQVDRSGGEHSLLLCTTTCASQQDNTY
jgi:hypothetical protein